MVQPELSGIHEILDQLPAAAKRWAEGLPWEERRYILSLCHLLCASSAQAQAEFLDTYTADGLITKIIEDQDIQRKVQWNLDRWRIETPLSEGTIRNYIRQFYIHSSQDVQRQPSIFLESALKWVVSTEDRNNILNYILGFELVKLLFSMSWFQHEKLYRLQRNQEDFFNHYIRPIQHAHRLNQIIVPRDEKLFFARRDFFVQKPEIPPRKLLQLAMVTFTAEATINFGFEVIRHPDWLVFDYEHIFSDDPEAVFPG